MRVALAASLALLLLGCSRESGAAPSPKAPAVAHKAPIVPRVHAHSPALDALRTALDRGDREAATRVLDAAQGSGAEDTILRARYNALDPRGTMEALRLIESARAADPKNPDVYATAAEIYAARASFETAWAEIERGEKACGESAELLRARGVVWICRENGAVRGLEHLQRARSIDPDLPFTTRAMAQAHLLVAKSEQQKKRPDAALMHVTASLGFEPEDVDARRLLSEVQAERGDFAGAIGTVEALVRDGLPLSAELASLHKKAGISLLLTHERERALEHFRKARENGLSDADLGSGALILLEESQMRVERGVKAYAAGDFALAEQHFRAALVCDPTSLAARNHLAVVLLKNKSCAEAATLWVGVIADARAEGIELPEPVHVNLAHAQSCAGDTAAARATLDEYLAREPEGEWVAQTRTALEHLVDDAKK